MKVKRHINYAMDARTIKNTYMEEWKNRKKSNAYRHRLQQHEMIYHIPQQKLQGNISKENI